jgi:outer membrane receptor for ferric coprogen and ferric-rhodotorulic acid
MYFFLPDTNGIENQFRVVYDNVELMHFRGEFALKTSEKVNVFLTANYYHYQTDSQSYAWHKPIYDATLAFKYNIKDKIIAGLDVFNQSETYSMIWNPAPETIKVKSFVDVSLNLEYRYTKVLSAYLMVNNITHRKNYYWSHYPTQRFNVMAGVSYVF